MIYKDPKQTASILRAIANSVKKQEEHINKSGWGWWDKRCAVYNLRGVSDLLETYADSVDMDLSIPGA